MEKSNGQAVEIVEVGPRDGFQPIGPFIPTETKVRFLERLVAAGVRRVEIGSFVSAKAVPQLRDTAEVLAAAARLPSLAAQVLVPSERRGREAVAAGAKHLVFVVSVTEAHNRNNVQRHPLESVAEYERLLAAIPPDVTMRLNLATTFDCPFTGGCRRRRRWLSWTAWCRCARTPRSACATRRDAPTPSMWRA